jgi:hypothetical protein
MGLIIAGLGKSMERVTNGLGKKMRAKLLSQLNRYGLNLEISARPNLFRFVHHLYRNPLKNHK